jgi:hypothetical protein
MIQMKRNSNAADFGDILASLDHARTERPSDAGAGKVKAEDDQAALEPEPRPAPRLRRLLGNISWRWWGENDAARSGPSAPYVEETYEPADAASPNEPAPNEPAASQSAPPPPTPAPTEDEEIAQELGLHADLASVELKRIRRDFAKMNHPDRFAPAQRIAAARRMTIANMLIDAHLKQKPTARSPNGAGP